jgi:hypothetical protein
MTCAISKIGKSMILNYLTKNLVALHAKVEIKKESKGDNRVSISKIGNGYCSPDCKIEVRCPESPSVSTNTVTHKSERYRLLF